MKLKQINYKIEKMLINSKNYFLIINEDDLKNCYETGSLPYVAKFTKKYDALLFLNNISKNK